MNHPDILACLSLLALPGCGTSLVVRLLHAAGSPSAALSLPDETLCVIGLPANTRVALRRLGGVPDPEVDALAERLLRFEVTLVAIHEPAYPPQLAQIARPPAVLFIRGNVAALTHPQVAMVGSRKPTPAGRKVAKYLAKNLSKYGLTITSGLAIGVDTECHRGALENGTSIAVMGTGPDRIYPGSNRELADSIVAGGGALVSEFLPGTRPEAANFPRRNRIISGLSLGVVVVEAALPSGSLVTAQCAAEQDREVMAVPGSVMSGVSHGCHMLLKNGAALVENAEDVLLALGDRFKPRNPISSVPLAPRVLLDSFNKEQRCVLEQTGYEPTSLDAIAAATGLGAAATAAAMTVLELHGLVAQMAGGYIRSG